MGIVWNRAGQPWPGSASHVCLTVLRSTMSEEEQFVNIDLNDDNICSVCKLETDTETMSFCHVCFELSIEGEHTSGTATHSHMLIETHTYTCS